MKEHETLFRAYCDAWLAGDPASLSDFFAENVGYTESDGSRYEGLAEIRKWFVNWLPHGRVLEWRIVRYLHQGNASAAEWFFRCRYDGVESGFNGVTLMDFGKDGKIIRLQEFAAQTAPERAENGSPDNVVKK